MKLVSIGLYMLWRYLNQLPVQQTYFDHLGNPQRVNTLNDLQLHRIIFSGLGWIYLPKLTYVVTAWTVNSTGQVALDGSRQCMKSAPVAPVAARVSSLPSHQTRCLKLQRRPRGLTKRPAVRQHLGHRLRDCEYRSLISPRLGGHLRSGNHDQLHEPRSPVDRRVGNIQRLAHPGRNSPELPLDLRADEVEIHVDRRLVVELQDGYPPFSLHIARVTVGALRLRDEVLFSGTRGEDERRRERKAANRRRR